MNTGQTIGVAAIVLLLSAYYAGTWSSVSVAKAAIDTCGRTFCDFASFYYPMGEAIFRTELPVTGFVYSPFIAIIFSVFPPLGFRASLFLWGVLQALSIIVYLLLFHRLVPAKLPIQLLFSALVLSSFPVLHVLTWGQVGLFTTIAILGALLFYERGQYVAAAVLLAFGLSFKFFPLIFFLPFVIRRDIRFLPIAAAACGLFLFGVPAILPGVNGTVRFYSALLDAYSQMDWVTANYNSQYFPHVQLRLLRATGVNGYAYLPLLKWSGYTVAVVNVGLICLIKRARLHYANLWSFHIRFLSIPFVLPTSWPVNLVYLPFGQALLAWQLLDGKEATSEDNRPLRRSPISKVTSVLLLLVSAIASNIIFFNLLDNSTLYGSAGIIFWANVLLLATSYVVQLPATLHQIRTSQGENLLCRLTASSSRSRYTRNVP